jgi:hypothetical protein
MRCLGKVGGGLLATAGTFLNFAYRTATDFTPRYYDKPFDLRQLESVDLLSSYGAGEAIAPLLVRFDVGGQDYGSHINARAQVVGDVPDFSQRIRAGLPRPPPAIR